MNRIARLAAWAALALGNADLSARGAALYTVTNLGAGTAASVNASGQVVGWNGAYAPFLWTPSAANRASGTEKVLGDAAGASGFTIASGVNGPGQFAGSDNNPTGGLFLWTPSAPNGSSGSSVDLGKLTGGVYAAASGTNIINNYGQVVGYTRFPSTSSTVSRAMLFTPTTPTGAVGTLRNLCDLSC